MGYEQLLAAKSLKLLGEGGRFGQGWLALNSYTL
jgi:hypothetical protein